MPDVTKGSKIIGERRIDAKLGMSRSSMLAYISSNKLIKNNKYAITPDVGIPMTLDTPGALMEAIENDRLSFFCKGLFLNPDWEDVGDYSGTPFTAGARLGLWQKTKYSTIIERSLEIRYINLAGGTFAPGDVITGTTSGATLTVITDNGSGFMSAFYSPATSAQFISTEAFSCAGVSAKSILNSYIDPVGQTIIGDTTFSKGIVLGHVPINYFQTQATINNLTNTDELYNFASGSGVNPYGTLIEVGGLLYGFTNSGGVLFSFDPAIRDYQVLHTFSGSDGLNGYGGLFEASDGKLYGMQPTGGAHGNGTIFSYDIGTDTFAKIYDFTAATDGFSGGASFIEVSGILYSVRTSGGANNSGTIISWNLGTSTFTKLFDFGSTNGRFPQKGLFEASDGFLYGVTSQGGANSVGVIYKWDIGGSTYTKIADCNNSTIGGTPQACFVEKAGVLYTVATTKTSAFGSIFSLTISGLTVALEQTFTGSNAPANFYLQGLILGTSGLLYGACSGGGPLGYGCFYSFDTSSKVITVLKNMIGFNGKNPKADPVEYSGKFYFTTSIGGYNDFGTIVDDTAEFSNATPFGDETYNVNKGYVEGSTGTFLFNPSQYDIVIDYNAPTREWLHYQKRTTFNDNNKPSTGQNGTWQQLGKFINQGYILVEDELEYDIVNDLLLMRYDPRLNVRCKDINGLVVQKWPWGKASAHDSSFDSPAVFIMENPSFDGQNIKLISGCSFTNKDGAGNFHDATIGSNTVVDCNIFSFVGGTLDAYGKTIKLLKDYSGKGIINSVSTMEVDLDIQNNYNGSLGRVTIPNNLSYVGIFNITTNMIGQISYSSETGQLFVNELFSSTNGVTGRIIADDASGTCLIKSATGLLQVGETITGATSGQSFVITAIVLTGVLSAMDGDVPTTHPFRIKCANAIVAGVSPKAIGSAVSTSIISDAHDFALVGRTNGADFAEFEISGTMIQKTNTAIMG